MTDRMRLSLFYPATYLVVSGAGLTFAPRVTLDMMFSTGDYNIAMVQMCGLFILGLAAIVIATIRHRLTALYPTLIGVRMLFCAGYVVLYDRTYDPFFLAVLGIVGFGLIVSCVSYALDAIKTPPQRTSSPAI